MRTRLGDLLDLVFALIDAFESSGIVYAFGGAIAYSTWAEPRATRDVDLNVWLSADELGKGFVVLERIGATLDREAASKDASSRGMFVARFRDIRITRSLGSMLDPGDSKLMEWERLQARVPTNRS